MSRRGKGGDSPSLEQIIGSVLGLLLGAYLLWLIVTHSWASCIGSF